jgi:hypothetical protein
MGDTCDLKRAAGYQAGTEFNGEATKASHYVAGNARVSPELDTGYFSAI